MKKIVLTLLLALTLGSVSLSSQNVGFWITTEGAGMHFNNGSGGFLPPPPPEFFYGNGQYRHHGYGRPMHPGKKHNKKMRKKYKKYIKAQEKYYKARHDYIKARTKARKHRHHHDYDD